VPSAAGVARTIAAVGLPFVPARVATTVTDGSLGSLEPLDHVDPSLDFTSLATTISLRLELQIDCIPRARVKASAARGLLVRHARDQRLRLVEVLELEDDRRRNGYVLTRLAALAAQSEAVALLTHGVQLDLAGKLADDLGVRHLPVPHTDRPHRTE
jgi:hypothetical protein